MTSASIVDRGETAGEILARAKEAGLSVSREQLERWHRAGALPAPAQIPLGPRGGSVSLYPSGAAEQAIAVARRLERTRRLDEVGFYLWCDGMTIAMRLVRRYLLRVARWHDRLTSYAQRAGFGAEELPDQALRLVAAIARMRGKGTPMAEVWARLGSLGDRETLIRLFLDAAAGRYVPTPSPDRTTYERESEGLLVERAVGISNGRTETLLDIGPWLSGSGGPAGRHSLARRWRLGGRSDGRDGWRPRACP